MILSHYVENVAELKKQPWLERWGKATAGQFAKRNNSLGALQKLCEESSTSTLDG